MTSARASRAKKAAAPRKPRVPKATENGESVDKGPTEGGEEAETESVAPPSRFIVVEDMGDRQYRISPQGYADAEVIPTILRRAAIQAEKAMGARE